MFSWFLWAIAGVLAIVGVVVFEIWRDQKAEPQKTRENVLLDLDEESPITLDELFQKYPVRKSTLVLSAVMELHREDMLIVRSPNPQVIFSRDSLLSLSGNGWDVARELRNRREEEALPSGAYE